MEDKRKEYKRKNFDAGRNENAHRFLLPCHFCVNKTDHQHAFYIGALGRCGGHPWNTAFFHTTRLGHYLIPDGAPGTHAGGALFSQHSRGRRSGTYQERKVHSLHFLLHTIPHLPSPPRLLFHLSISPPSSASALHPSTTTTNHLDHRYYFSPH